MPCITPDVVRFEDKLLELGKVCAKLLVVANTVVVKHAGASDKSATATLTGRIDALVKEGIEIASILEEMGRQ